MASDAEFKIDMRKLLQEQIDSVINDTETDFKQIWSCNSLPDFLYGWIVGSANGFFLNLFALKNGRPPNPQEMTEMREEILLKVNEIREKLKIS
jgi:hypothetical protein